MFDFADVLQYVKSELCVFVCVCAVRFVDIDDTVVLFVSLLDSELC